MHNTLRYTIKMWIMSNDADKINWKQYPAYVYTPHARVSIDVRAAHCVRDTLNISIKVLQWICNSEFKK